MKKLLSIVTIGILLFSCSKKHEDPQPEVTKQTVHVQVAVTPYYRVINDWQCCPNPGCSNLVIGYEKFVGHDDNHVPKADVWKRCYVPTGSTDTVTVSVFKIWWINGQPYSDLLIFRKSTIAGEFDRSYGKTYEVTGKETTCYVLYERK